VYIICYSYLRRNAPSTPLLAVDLRGFYWFIRNICITYRYHHYEALVIIQKVAKLSSWPARLPCPAALSRMTCPCWLVLSVRTRLTCRGWTVQADLSRLTYYYQNHLPYLVTCPDWAVSADLSPVTCPCEPFLANQYLRTCPCWPVSAGLSRLTCPGWPVQADLPRLIRSRF
jgi:hypothetical protein